MHGVQAYYVHSHDAHTSLVIVIVNGISKLNTIRDNGLYRNISEVRSITQPVTQVVCAQTRAPIEVTNLVTTAIRPLR